MNQNVIGFIIILLIVFYLGQRAAYSQIHNPNAEYGTLNERPSLLSPFNQPSSTPQRNANRRIFDVDPQPWDVKNDPEYYLADLQQRYPNLELSSDLV